jgi:hypothetical protein
MSRIIVEYNPPLSEVAQKIIREDVTPSMISEDESSCQYAIEMCIDSLDDDLNEDDFILLKELEGEGVHYIEF